LPARHVIHTVGPIWHGGNANEANLLAQCYRNSLRLAHQHQLRSIAFPAISCGIYGYPLEQAATIAVDTVCEELKKMEDVFEEVIFCCFSSDTAQHYRTALARHAL
jgi:O-acetyl-ADP-ribose deacetylase (regulator of RNase III)